MIWTYAILSWRTSGEYLPTPSTSGRQLGNGRRRSLRGICLLTTTRKCLRVPNSNADADLTDSTYANRPAHLQSSNQFTLSWRELNGSKTAGAFVAITGAFLLIWMFCDMFVVTGSHLNSCQFIVIHVSFSYVFKLHHDRCWLLSHFFVGNLWQLKHSW